METKNAIVIFEDLPIRKVEKDGKVWISAIDVAKALEYLNPSATIKNILDRNIDRFKDYTICIDLETRGGIQNQTFFDIKGVISFCMLSKQPKAIPFQRWADTVLAIEIINIPNDIRIMSKKRRVVFTDTLKAHGYKNPHEYIQTTIQMKEGLGIKKEKKKDECDLIEIAKIAAAEMLATAKILISKKEGYSEVNPVCVESSKIIENNTRGELK
ncbi:MAG: Bro-N domain-containing protein [Eubacteriales bacterium]|nr:Bro-N domain-containing protein [Eubacteriales bacterium]